MNTGPSETLVLRAFPPEALQQPPMSCLTNPVLSTQSAPVHFPLTSVLPPSLFPPLDQPRWADHKPPGKRPAPGYGQRGGEDIDDDSDVYLNQGTNPGVGAGRGFQSAKTAMIADCKKKGIQPPPSMTNNSQVGSVAFPRRLMC